jgi:hypothetical protein
LRGRCHGSTLCSCCLQHVRSPAGAALSASHCYREGGTGRHARVEYRQQVSSPPPPSHPLDGRAAQTVAWFLTFWLDRVCVCCRRGCCGDLPGTAKLSTRHIRADDQDGCRASPLPDHPGVPPPPNTFYTWLLAYASIVPALALGSCTVLSASSASSIHKCLCSPTPLPPSLPVPPLPLSLPLLPSFRWDPSSTEGCSPL